MMTEIDYSLIIFIVFAGILCLQFIIRFPVKTAGCCDNYGFEILFSGASMETPASLNWL